MLKTQFPYFDNNATTPIHPEVLTILHEYQERYYANPSSKSHPAGMICHALYEQHIQVIADILNISPHELIITSGASESINTAIKGLYFQYAAEKNHIITCRTEHSAVLNTLEYLKQYHRAEVTFLDVDANGQISLDELENSITERTLMVCLMAANNETGVLHPINDIHHITKKKKVLFFSDTTQVFGKLKWTNISADIYCGSAHKFYGCKGVGFLVIKNLGRRVFLHPLIHGGNQQIYRSGTLPLPLIAGLSKALQIIYTQHDDKINYVQNLRDTFESTLKQKFNVIINGGNSPRIANTSNVLFDEKYQESLIRLMKKYCYSHGSACSDGSGKPSHVLSAMQLSDKQIKQSFRFSFSHFNTIEEIQSLISELGKSIMSIDM